MAAPTRPRNVTREHELTASAARAAGFDSDGGLSTYADARAHPGPVFITRRNTDEPRDWIREAREELADTRNYCIWGIEENRALASTGDQAATAVHDQLLRCLAHTIAAWHALA